MLRAMSRTLFLACHLGCAAVASLSLVACGDDDGVMTPTADASVDGAVDGAVPESCGVVAELDTSGTSGHAEPLGAAAGEARAGRIRADQLPADAWGLLHWRGDDFVLANDHIAVVIEDVGDSDGYDPFGGRPVGLAAVEGGQLVRPANFNEAGIGLARFLVATETVTVVNDGSDGNAAVVRAVGPMRPIPFIDELAAALAPGEYGDIDGAIDYVLEPDADHVDVFYTFRSERPTPTRVATVIDLFFQPERMPRVIPGQGFGPFEAGTPWIGFVDDGATSYAWRPPSGELRPFLEISGALAVLQPMVNMDPCAQTRVPMGRLHIGGPGLDGLVAAIARSEGEADREITGLVTEADGSTPIPDARVHAQLADGTYLTRARTDGSGRYRLHVPDATAVEVLAYRPGDALVGPLAVAAASPGVDVMFGPSGFIAVNATDTADGSAMPARVQVIPRATVARPPPTFGEPLELNERLHIAFPTDGEVTLRAAVGTHQVIVSRGYEYEIVSQDVTVAADATVMVNAPLERVVDTTGMLCADYHVHTHASPDADDTVERKLAAAVADGLEIALRSDHEWIGDFEPKIAEMGIGDYIYGVGSEELTTFLYGHFGVFPLVADDTLPNRGAIGWVGEAAPALFDMVRARPEAPSFIINHPRAFGGFGAAGAYFDAAGYDPVTATPRRPEMWDDEFTLVEVFNESDFDENRDGSVADWLSLLGSGRRVFAVGSSDSHHVDSTPVGYPRTCLPIGTDDPRTLTSEMVQTVTEAGQGRISGGIYVDAVARGDVGPGGDLDGAMATEMVHVTVQAATWIAAKRLEVIVDGVTTEMITLDATTVDPSNPVIRFENDIEIDVADGGPYTYAIFVVHGDEELLPVHPAKRAFGVTNPIFFHR